MSNTYLLVDGENIDATLGMSVLDRRPAPEERPRWDRILEASRKIWGHTTQALFFLNGSSGTLPMPFVQALMAMDYIPVPLSGPSHVKVVDRGIQLTLQAIDQQEGCSVLLASHDGDFVPEVRQLLESGHTVGVVCFKEFLAAGLQELVDLGLEVFDLEADFDAFQVRLPRLRIIDIEEYDPHEFLRF